MNIKPIRVPYCINRFRKQSTDMIAVSHENNVNTRVLEVVPVDGDGEPLAIAQTCTATAAITFSRPREKQKYLVNNSVACEITPQGGVRIPIDNLGRYGTVDLWIELTVEDENGGKVLTLPYPIWVRVNASLLDDAAVTPESEGTIPDLLREASEELERQKSCPSVQRSLPAQEVSDSGVSGFEPIPPAGLAAYTVGELQQLPVAEIGLFTRAYNAAHDYAFDVYHTLNGKTYCRMHSRVVLLDRVTWLKTPWYSQA